MALMYLNNDKRISVLIKFAFYRRIASHITSDDEFNDTKALFS